jgi:hypothetical protein
MATGISFQSCKIEQAELRSGIRERTNSQALDKDDAKGSVCILSGASRWQNGTVRLIAKSIGKSVSDVAAGIQADLDME